MLFNFLGGGHLKRTQENKMFADLQKERFSHGLGVVIGLHSPIG